MVDTYDDSLLYGRKVDAAKNEWSIGEYFYKRLEAGGDKIAQIIEDDGDGDEGVLRYSDVLHSGKVVAGFLRKLGLTPKDAVLSVTGNTLEYSPIFWGTLFVGATISAVSPLHGLGDISHFLQTIRPQIVLSNEHSEPVVREALSQYEDKDVVFITLEEMLSYLKENLSEEGFYVGKIDNPDTHIASALFTSGSSGTAKCVQMSDSAIMRQMDLPYFNDTINNNAGDKDGTQEVSVNMFGPYCVSGQAINLLAINALRTCLLVPRETFTAQGFFNALVKYKVNFIALSPSELISMIKSDEAGTCDLSSLKACLVGGAPVSRAMLELAKSKLKINATPVYAMTEIIGVCNPAYGVTNRPGTVGKLADNVVAKLVDVTTGKTLGPYEQGELLVKAPYEMLSYRNKSRLTAAALDEDGFFRTGDIGSHDEDGYLYMVDRIQDQIKYKDMQIPAVDIEAVLLRHIKVKEVCVVGVFHDIDCEHATAIVVIKEGETVTEEELVNLVKKNLPEMKWLYGGLHFVASLPYSLNSNIERRLLRDAYNSKVARKIVQCEGDTTLKTQ